MMADYIVMDLTLAVTGRVSNEKSEVMLFVTVTTLRKEDTNR